MRLHSRPLRPPAAGILHLHDRIRSNRQGLHVGIPDTILKDDADHIPSKATSTLPPGNLLSFSTDFSSIEVCQLYTPDATAQNL